MHPYEKFLVIMDNKVKEHTGIARRLCAEAYNAKTYKKSIDRLNDTKFHDGMANMASVLKMEFIEVFDWRRIKPKI